MKTIDKSNYKDAVYLKTVNDANDIVSTMDSKDKKLLGLHGKEYQALNEGQKIVKRLIKKVDGVPVSFF